jgi:hypothetical protein
LTGKNCLGDILGEYFECVVTQTVSLGKRHKLNPVQPSPVQIS